MLALLSLVRRMISGTVAPSALTVLAADLEATQKLLKAFEDAPDKKTG